MSQGVIIALLVLAGLLVLRVTNLPPFSGNPNATQSPTAGQVSPTPITRSTGFSTGVATASETTPLVPNTTQPPSSSTGSGASTSTETVPQRPIRGKW